MHPMQRLVLLQLNGVLASRATLVMVGPCVLRQTLWRPRGWTLLCLPLDAVVGHVHKSDPLCLLTGGGPRMGRREDPAGGCRQDFGCFRVGLEPPVAVLAPRIAWTHAGSLLK